MGIIGVCLGMKKAWPKASLLSEVWLIQQIVMVHSIRALGRNSCFIQKPFAVILQEMRLGRERGCWLEHEGVNYVIN